MKVHELMSVLEDMNPDAELKIADQPEWPFQNRVDEAVSVEIGVKYVLKIDGEPVASSDSESEIDEMREDALTDMMAEWECDRCVAAGRVMAETDESEASEVVFIAAGQQECYLPQPACEALGWDRRNS